MKSTLGIYPVRQMLSAPYHLSFATLEAFESIIVALQVGGQLGLGEITTLPGYSAETPASARRALEEVIRSLEEGAGWEGAVAAIAEDNPFVTSGLVCARETLDEGLDTAFETPVEAPILMSALCGGRTPEEAAAGARALLAEGYKHLKLKVGGGAIAQDVERVTAVAGVLGDQARMSIDANQKLTFEDAVFLCNAVAALPVALIEQPFAPGAWRDFARLADRTDVPLVLDESIWTESDIARAAELGAAGVKLKLCKHPGMAENRRLISLAQARNLEVIYGNGVQGVVGNHLEARVYTACGLQTAGELNGFLKLANAPFRHALTVADGHLVDRGIGGLRDTLTKLEPASLTAFII